MISNLTRASLLDRSDVKQPGLNLSKDLLRRHFCYLAFCAASLLVFRTPLTSVLALSLDDERYRHIPLIPLLCAFVLYMERGRIFHVQRRTGVGVGVALLAVAAPLALLPRHVFLTSADTAVSSSILATIFVWAAGFVFCYGMQALRSALFPFCLLLLAVPLPATWLDQIAVTLQKGSAEVSYILFKVLGVPVLRDGFRFYLPGISVQIAQQCSGINSSLALFIVGLIAAHLFLRSTRGKVLLIVATLPVLIAKNVLRIVTISLLAVYVSRDYLHGNLHRYGGVPFSLVGLALLLYPVMALRRLEAWLS